MNTIDLIVILIILGFIAVGAIRGLIRSAIGLTGYGLSIFLAYKFSASFSSFMIEHLHINEKINSVIVSFIPKIATNLVSSNEKYSSILGSGANMDFIEDTLANTKLPFIDVISGRIVQILAMILLFVIFKFIFEILGKLLNDVAKLPILKEVNKIGGMIIGAIEGVLVSVILLVVVSLVPNANLQEKVSNSYIGNKVSQAVVSISVSDVINMNS